MGNFIMIGMPGSGKSTLGRILANELGYNFLDTDRLILDHYQKPLMTLIDEMGVEGFIQAESAVLEKIDVNHTVIATGGSVIYGEKGMQHLRSLGQVIYLCYSLGDISARVGNLMKRGVVCRNSHTLQELFNERRPYYEKYADIIVHLEHASVNKSIQRLKKAVAPYL